MQNPAHLSDAGPYFPRRGEVWLINTNPVMPRDPHLPRPVIVVSTDSRNKAWDSVIVVPLSTGISNINVKFHKAIPKGEGGLDRDSYARCDLVSNIEKLCLDNLKGPLGLKLSDKYMFDIVRGVRASIRDKPDL